MTQRWWISVCVLAALTAGGASTVQAAQPTTPGQIAALVTHLKTDADKWVKGQIGDRERRTTAIKIKAITYDEKNIATLTPLIRSVTIRSRPESLYVLNRLLRPLLMAKADVIRKVMPVISTVHRSAGQYKAVPTQLRKVRKMATPTGRMTSDAIVAAIAATQVGTGEQDKVREIKLWNEEVHMLKMTVYELIIFAEDPRTDRQLLTMLIAGESRKLYAFVEICETVKKHVRSLSKARALAYHKDFASLGGRLRATKGSYAKHYEYRTVGGKLTPVTVPDYPGIRLLTTANLLAPVAGKSAVVVPTREQIEAYIKKRR